jgi:thiol-disulfide isomerase/thioredoxin
MGALALGSMSMAQDRPFNLMVGDKAPDLTVSKFLKGKPITKFEAGKVYVVEFWATWCGPCKTSIPHLTELQKKYGDKVTVVGVSIWENKQADIEPFVADWAEKMDYTVAVDKGATEAARGQDGAMAKNWMAAGGRNGIPSAFIVDRAGKIAWVGHPMGMDEPLEQVVSGQWDAERFKNENLPTWQKEAKAAQFSKDINALLKEQKNDEALAYATQGMTDGNPSAFSWKYRILSGVMKDEAAAAKFLDENLNHAQFGVPATMTKYNTLMMKKDFDAAFGLLDKAIDTVLKDQSNLLNSVAWQIVDPASKLEKKNFDLALKAAERSVAIEKGWANLDTLARAYFAKGDRDKAAETMREAIALAPADEKVALAKTLKEYEANK